MTLRVASALVVLTYMRIEFNFKPIYSKNILTNVDKYRKAKNLKEHINGLYYIYLGTSVKNKSFEKINELQLKVGKYFWAIDRPKDLDDNCLRFWVINNYVCCYTLENIDIIKLREIKKLKSFTPDIIYDIEWLINEIIRLWLELRELYSKTRYDLSTFEFIHDICNKVYQNGGKFIKFLI